MPGINLYSVFHKPFYKPAAEFIIPVQAGRILATDKMEMQGDDTGENISAINPVFCELTAIYWIIKNADRSAGAWGLCHYRRYFMAPKLNFLLKNKSVFNFHPTPQKMDEMVNAGLYKKVEKLLLTHDAIVQQPKYIHKKKRRYKKPGGKLFSTPSRFGLANFERSHT